MARGLWFSPSLFIALSTAACLSEGLASADTSDEGVPALQEIVVTAQKRSEKLEDVPIVITAISGEGLKNTGVETTADLQMVIPSLVYNNLAGFALPFMRGVGSDVIQPNSDPSVATYIDGAFVAYSQGTIQNLLGVQQIEVLEGPQGTLYGRNSVAGAINISTLTPSHETEAEASVTEGNYSRREGAFHISGGVTDTLAIGLYVGGVFRHRYITDITYQPVNDPYQPDHEDAWGARVKAVFTPTDWLTLTGSFETSKVFSFETAALREISPNALGYVLFPNVPRVIDNYEVQTAFPDHNNTIQKAGNLREEVDLSWSRILGISNFRNVSVDGADDDATTGSPIYTDTARGERDQQFSQELQLISRPESSIQWIGGAYFFHEYGGFFPQASTSGILFAPPLYSVSSVPRVVTNSLAGFAQATIPLDMLFEGLRLTAGGRYTTEKKQFSDVQSYLDVAGDSIAPFAVYPEKEHRWNRFTPKLTVDYKADNTLFYATYSEGFKSGAYNLNAPSQTTPVNPEQLKAYEIGTKSQLFNKRINWNNSFYFYNWKNLQIDVVSTDTGGATFLENAASARLYGLESSVTAAVTEELTANVALSLEHTKYQSFPNYDGVDPATLGAVTYNATGNQLQRAPKAVFTAGGDYKRQLEKGGRLHASLNWYFNSGYYWTPQNSYRQDAYQLVNGTLGFTPDGHWDVSTWVRNLTNTHYFQTVLPIAGLGTLAQDAPPRMFGLTADYKF